VLVEIGGGLRTGRGLVAGADGSQQRRVHAGLVARAGMHGYVESDDLTDRPGEMPVQVAEHVVVRGVDHGLVERDVGRREALEVAGRPGRIPPGQQRVEPTQVVGGATACGQNGGLRLQALAHLEHLAWLCAVRAAPHPLASFVQGLRLTNAPGEVPTIRHEFVYLTGWHGTPFTGTYERLREHPGWRTHTLGTGPNAMREAPAEFATLLTG